MVIYIYFVDFVLFRRSQPRALRFALRDVIEPELRGDQPARADLTLNELVELYLERHVANVRPRTIATLTERLRHAERAFGNVPLRELERMAGDIAVARAADASPRPHASMPRRRRPLGPPRRTPVAGRNPQPPPRAIRAYGRDELDAIAAELHPAYAPLPIAAATGLRPQESRIALERRDIDRRARVLNVVRTMSAVRSSILARRAPAAASCSRCAPSPRWTGCRHFPLIFPAARRPAGLAQLVAARVGAGDRGVRRRAPGAF